MKHFLGCLLLVAATCTSEGGTVQEADTPVLPTSAFEPVKTIALEESDEVVNVSPEVSVQQDGSFLIADGREARIRIYDPDGRLLTQFGRKGEGPGELGLPLEATRRSDGSILVADFSRGLLHFDSSGTRFLGGTRPPIRPLYTVEPLDSHRFLVSGLHRGAADPRELMHVWDQEPRGASNVWNLLRTDLDGHRYFDVRNTPELLAVKDELLVFVHPESYTPDKWLIVRLR